MAKLIVLIACLAMVALAASQGVQPGSSAAASATANAAGKKEGDLQTASSVFYGLGGYGGYGLGYGYGGYGLGYGLGYSYGYPYYGGYGYRTIYGYPGYGYGSYFYG
ncbi:unnamed protein product [Allacma fusca]|uniref:Uncharacterized protein n=1 Tax=Allacma fusca TaxID=39272 RepID=A0A8J2K0E4_9HEXA|nr:unnamed protein product [Allacma fusca]